MWDLSFHGGEDSSQGLAASIHPEDEGSEVLWNTGFILQHYVVSQPRSPNLYLFLHFICSYY